MNPLAASSIPERLADGAVVAVDAHAGGEHGRVILGGVRDVLGGSAF